ncbi:hypothetical protein [Streptomyces cavernicola]|uniref:Uncharacterized protein n=1 Tax=Streptomyces cavernicola TaxID=3043613 RepID=A0ABT6SDP9_9ACTN|nr:hypothetical protein [Streptomyces sp. B-S-A6]MDI3406303.1 hypothetical protein [Streptomyces sp. B-S-A6]
MARHRKPVPVRAVTRQARRNLAVGLAAASALAATLLTATVDPSAPPAPDRLPATSSRSEPQAAP